MELGEEKEEGREDAQALSSAGPASGCWKGPATSCAFLGRNTLSVLRAHLRSWYILEENYLLPLNPTEWGRKGMVLHTRKGYFQQEGAAVFPL